MKDFAGKLILASNSPRRKQLLRQSGFEFEVVTTFYKEERFETFSYENIKKVIDYYLPQLNNVRRM